MHTEEGKRRRGRQGRSTGIHHKETKRRVYFVVLETLIKVWVTFVVI